MRSFLFMILLTLQCNSYAGNFSSYIAKASDESQSMRVRWNALIRAGDYAKKNEIEQIRVFTHNKHWFMRNAALISLSKISPDVAAADAKKLLQDKALVVRSAAVEVLAYKMTVEHKKVLFAEMNKKYNFHKKSSLWIRKQIIEKLSSVASIKDRDLFVKSLFDSDKEISRISAQTLEKITGEHIEGLRYVEKWKALVKEKKWL